MTKSELISTLSSSCLIQSADNLADDILATSDVEHYYEALVESFDLVVAELTARGLWYGEWA